MATSLKIKITPAVAVFVGPQATGETKLQGIASAGDMSPSNRLVLLFCLAGDRDPVVRAAAATAFAALPTDACIDYLRQTECHPAVLDLIARSHHEDPTVNELLRGHPALSDGAREFLERHEQIEQLRESAEDAGRTESCLQGDPGESVQDVLREEQGDGWSEEGLPEEDIPEEADGDFDQQGEEFLSKYQMAQIMGIADKIKMALTGDKEWRAILVKDANKLVSGSVVKNPRITEGEILTILKVGVQNDEIIRLICANKEWVKNYKIRKALVDSPKTPLPNALRYLASLSEKDIAGYAKSKNISSVISTQAKRMLLQKKR